MQRELKILVLLRVWLEGLRTLREAKQLPREVPALKSSCQGRHCLLFPVELGEQGNERSAPIPPC